MLKSLKCTFSQDEIDEILVEAAKQKLKEKGISSSLIECYDTLVTFIENPTGDTVVIDFELQIDSY